MMNFVRRCSRIGRGFQSGSVKPSGRIPNMARRSPQRKCSTSSHGPYINLSFRIKPLNVSHDPNVRLLSRSPTLLSILRASSRLERLTDRLRVNAFEGSMIGKITIEIADALKDALVLAIIITSSPKLANETLATNVPKHHSLSFSHDSIPLRREAHRLIPQALADYLHQVSRII